MTNINFPTKIMTQIEQELYKQEKPDYNYAELIPVRTDINPGATSVMTLAVETTGEAVPVLGKAGEGSPTGGFKATSKSVNILTMGLSYTIDLEDILAAQGNGNIDPLRIKAESAFEGFHAGTQRMLLSGNDDADIEGLNNFTLPTAQEKTSAATFAATANTATVSKAEALARAISDAITACRTQTKGVRNPNTIVLPLAAYDALVDARFPNSANYTALDAILASAAAKSVTDFRIVPSAFAGNDMLVYSFDRNVLGFFMAQPITFKTPQELDLGYKVPGYSRISALQVRNDKAFYRLKGVA